MSEEKLNSEVKSQSVEQTSDENELANLGYEPKLYAPGSIVYRRGEKANSIYIIESGEAQVFTSSKIKTISLMEYKEGAILGTDLLYNDGVHSYSVMAKTKLVVKVYSVEAFRKMISSFPSEVRNIIVDQDRRLETAISRLGKALRYVDDTANSIPMLPLCLQIIGVVQNFTKFFVDKQQDDKSIIIVDSLFKKLSSVINANIDSVIKIFNVLIKSGLLAVRESVTNKYILLESFEKLYSFRDFVNTFNAGGYPLLVKYSISPEESKLLLNIVKYCKKLDLDLEKPIRIKILDLQESLHGLSGADWDPVLAEKVSKTGLISFKTLESINYLELCPVEVSRTLYFLTAMNKLANLYEELSESASVSLGPKKIEPVNKAS